MTTYSTLISACDLASNYQLDNWVVVDCRYDLADPAAGRQAYLSGHIPSARFADLSADLSDNRNEPGARFRGRHPLPDPRNFMETLRGWGINDDTQVVAYDAHGGMYAARLWWMLRWVGHSAVAVLDGGFQAWMEAGLPVTTDLPSITPGAIQLRTGRMRVVSADDLLAQLATQQLTIVDARSPDRFRGENEVLDPVGGHIPGAKNRFFRNNLEANGRFKSAGQLRAEFAGTVTEPEQAVMQCGSGVSACHNLLAMEIAGLSGAALYPGSWSEWCADPARPVERGEPAAPGN